MKHPVVDDKSSCYGMIGDIHHLIHLGTVFSVGGLFQDLADDATLDILIRTGAGELHLDYEIDAGGDMLYFGLEGVVGQTAAGVVLGTALTPYNKYREKSDITGVEFWIVPALVSTGTTLLAKFIPGGTKNQASGGSGGGRDEWILNPNTDYALRIMNIAAAAKTFGAVLEYYEIEEE